MIEHEHEVVGIAVASSTLAESADAAVVAFDCRVGEPVLGPRGDTIDVAPEHLPEPDEWFEPRPVEQAAPAHQELAHAARSRIGPGMFELLLEDVGPEEAPVHREQQGKRTASTPVHAAVLAQQQEPLAADGLAIRAAATPELLLADLI